MREQSRMELGILLWILICSLPLIQARTLESRTINRPSSPDIHYGIADASANTYANSTIHLLFRNSAFKTTLVDAPIVLGASIEYSPASMEYKHMFGYTFEYLTTYPSVFASVSGIGINELRFYLYLDNGTGIVYPSNASTSDLVEIGYRDWPFWTSTGGYGASSGFPFQEKLSNITLGGRLLLQGFILYFEDGSEVDLPNSQLLLAGTFHLDDGRWTSDVGVWNSPNKTTYLGNSDISMLVEQPLPLNPIVVGLAVLSIFSVVIVVSLVIIRRGVRHYRSVVLSQFC